MKKIYFLITISSLFFNLSIKAQSSDELWTPTTKLSKKEFNKINKDIGLKDYKLFDLNLDLFKEKLKSSKKLGSKGVQSGIKISFPNDLGQLKQFEIFEASVMSDELQTKFPDIRSYIGYNVEGKSELIRFSFSSIGLNAIQLSSKDGVIKIKPYSINNSIYAVYSSNNIIEKEPLECNVQELFEGNNKKTLNKSNKTTDLTNGKLRVFRLAVTVTGEYSQYHLNRLGISTSSATSLKKEKVLSVMVATMTNVNAVFERDLAIRLELVDEIQNVIFLDSESDYLDNYKKYDLLYGNEDVLGSNIGIENYDIGHVFAHANLGGLAFVGAVCKDDGKYGGVSSSHEPIGDYFEGVIMHEIGHQFGAFHTFNSDTVDCKRNRWDLSAVEPGSGTTIMSYAGTCSPQNVQLDKELYFHFISIQQIWSYIDDFNCGSIIQTSNTAPSIESLNDYIVPILTPFVLKAQASDLENDEMTFNWEQLDSEITSVPPIPSNTIGASFRSYYPSLEPDRYFPNKETVNSGAIQQKWEVLPSVGRTMRFGLSVRDNNTQVGQVVMDELLLTFDGNSGPFIVTSQEVDEIWQVGSSQTILWDEANTTEAPINCSRVNILLSEDGGETYPYMLSEETDNDGEAEIIVPNISSEGVKIKVESVSNIFYSVNKGYITINSTSNKTFVPDDNFEQELMRLGYDSKLDNYVDTQKIKNVTNLDVINLNITNLKGIEDFESLTTLNCSRNNISKIDLTSNLNLKSLNVEFNFLENIDLSKNVNLTSIYAQSNNIKSINLSKLTQLNILSLKNNKLSVVDVSLNSELYSLDVSSEYENYNQLEILDVSKNLKLESLSFSRNKLNLINVSSNVLLKSINGSHNLLKEIDISNNTQLQKIYLDFNELENLNISNSPDLEVLNVNKNKLRQLNVLSNRALINLSAQLNNISEIDISKNSKLIDFNVLYNNLLCIKVSLEQLSNIPANWYKDFNTEYSTNCNSTNQKDTDFDGVFDHIDFCPNTPTGVEVNEYGCSDFQWDADGDGVSLDLDLCPNSELNEPVNNSGCSVVPTVLFGPLQNGGTEDDGILFQFDLESKEHSKVVVMNTYKGNQPYGGLTQASNGKLYGLTAGGGQAYGGVLYEYDPIIDKYETYVNFSYETGNNPVGNLIQASNGRLYGLTQGGGSLGLGMIFEFNIETKEFKVLYEFEGGVMGQSARGSLIQASNGKLYGLTSYGGENNDGTLFEYDLENEIFTKKIDFLNYETGKHPYFNLIEGTNNKLYGVSMYGGDKCDGTLFEFDPATNEFGIKYKFDYRSEGIIPNSILTLGHNNKIYGITHLGGQNDKGVIFEYDYLRNRYTKKIDLDNYIDEGLLMGGLVHSVNGKFYFMNRSEYTNDGTASKILEYDSQSNNIEVFDISSAGKWPGILMLEWIKEDGDFDQDDDNDGVQNINDDCYYTPLGEEVGVNGCSESQVTIIPDANFEQVLIDLGIDTDGKINQKVFTTDIVDVINLVINDKSIEDLTGIENFKNLKRLIVYRNQLTSLDLSQNTYLEILNCSINQLTTIDVTQNLYLLELKSSFNSLTSIDVSHNINLHTLSCNNNQLTGLDLSNNQLISDFNSWSNFDLYCIEVENESSAQAGLGIYQGWNKDSTTIFSEDCSAIDNDNDGVMNGKDLCPETPDGETVNENGCSQSQLDDDNDGVTNDKDLCPETPEGETVNENGCSQSQLDDDNDGVMNYKDLCPETPNGESVDENGCSQSQIDDDNDGVMNDKDLCPETPEGETVNENGCSQSQLDDDNDGVMNDKDLCPVTPTGETVNENGCSQSQLDDDNDGVMNDKDLCPETPEGETVNENGCSQSELDDDNDGVMNDKDLCPETPEGETVNFNGCIVLPSTNFKIEAINETCPNKNNGQIKIVATDSHNYLATINSDEYSFTDSLNIENLEPGTYDICIIVPNITSRQCYTIEIAEGKTVSGKASTTANKTAIEIEKGTAPFDVIVNGQLLFKTMSSTFDLTNKHGDLIEIKTAISCEGIFSKTINLFEEIVVFPNPTKGIFEVALPLSLKEIKIDLFTLNSQLISSEIYQVINGKVQLDIRNKPNAVYLIKVHLENPVSVKIIKE